MEITIFPEQLRQELMLQKKMVLHFNPANSIKTLGVAVHADSRP